MATGSWSAWLFSQGFLRGAALSQIYQALRRDNAFFARDALEEVSEVMDAAEPRWRTLIEDASGRDWGR